MDLYDQDDPSVIITRIIKCAPSSSQKLTAAQFVPRVEYQSSWTQSAQLAPPDRSQITKAGVTWRCAQIGVTPLSLASPGPPPASPRPSDAVVTVHVPADVPQDHVEDEQNGEDEESHQDRLGHGRDEGLHLSWGDPPSARAAGVGEAADTRAHSGEVLLTSAEELRSV